MARPSGFTLVELMIAGTVSALVLTSICGIYFAVARDWERGKGEADALMATSTACSRSGDYISQAMSAYPYTRFTENDTLILTMPLDTAYGSYVPTWVDGKLQTQSGDRLVFYLSDSTGSISRNGDILWKGTLNCWTYVVTPDSGWSLYSGDNSGKITPLCHIRFDVTEGDDRTRVGITAKSAYTIFTGEKSLQQNATFCLRN